MTYVLIFVSLAFTTAGQLLQKLAADRAARSAGGVFMIRLLRQSRFWWAIACLAAGTASWLGVLFRMEVSKAFPFLSLGFVLVMLVSRFHLHESVGAVRWLGVALICAGIGLMSLA